MYREKWLLQLTNSKIVLVLLATVLFNGTFNLSTFPEYFDDQGVYVQRAINFLKDSQVYDGPYYIDHPPLGWIILSIFFWPMGFPDSIIHSTYFFSQNTLESQLALLTLIPRLVMTLFTVVIAALVYRLSLVIHENNKNFAVMSLATFVLIPALWPFRNVLIDPIMITFVLSSLFLLVSRQTANHKTVNDKTVTTAGRSIVEPRLIVSGILFGIAILIKLTAIFFLPAIILFAIGYGSAREHNKDRLMQGDNHSCMNNPHGQFNSKQKIARGAVWLVPVAVAIISWALFLIRSDGTLDYLISTQLWQLSRVSMLPSGIALLFLLVASPIALLYGTLGLGKIFLNKHKRIWGLLALPYIGFLLRGGFVIVVHTIPLLPILSIYAGKPFYLLVERQLYVLSKFRRREIDLQKAMSYFIPVIIVISVLLTVWIASFDAAKSNIEATKFLIDKLPVNSILVGEPGLTWLIETYRPDVQILEIHELQYMDKIPEEIYLAEHPSIMKYEPPLKESQYVYENSCIIAEFRNDPEYFHPYSMIPDRWWNVEVRHFKINGCSLE